MSRRTRDDECMITDYRSMNLEPRTRDRSKQTSILRYSGWRVELGGHPVPATTPAALKRLADGGHAYEDRMKVAIGHWRGQALDQAW